MPYSISYSIISFSMQTFQTEFGEPDRRGRASKVLNHKNKNTSHSTEKHERSSSNEQSGITYSRQMSNRVRSKMTTAKEKIRSTTPSIGLASGLLLWIPGFGGGKHSRGSMSPRDNKFQEQDMDGNNEPGWLSTIIVIKHFARHNTL